MKRWCFFEILCVQQNRQIQTSTTSFHQKIWILHANSIQIIHPTLMSFKPPPCKKKCLSRWFFLCAFVPCVSDTMERNHYLLPSGDHVKTSRSFLASYYATTHPQQSSLSLTPATFRMLSQQQTFLPTYPWQPSLMLFRYHTPWSHFPAPYPGSLSPRRLQHHTPQCTPRL